MKRLPAIPKIWLDRLVLPLLLSGLLSTAWYFILYNRSAPDLFGRLGDPFFLVAGLALPAAATVGLAFVIPDKARLGLASAGALMATTWAATWWVAHHGASLPPDYYRDFEASGSFPLLYLFYTLLFLFGGHALGFLSRAADPLPSPDAVIARIDAASGASKAQRRKKKRKKALLKKRGELGGLVDDVLGGTDGGDAEADDDGEGDDAGEGDEDGDDGKDPA